MNARLLPRNVRFDGGNVPSFLAGEEWVAVPAEDFDALRAEATPDNAGRSSIDENALVEAMNWAYRYKDRDHTEPVLPFMDDVEAFWRPFAREVVDEYEAALSESTGSEGGGS